LQIPACRSRASEREVLLSRTSIDLSRDLPDWLSARLVSFGISLIDFESPIESLAALSFMDRVFGLNDAFLDYLVKQGTPQERERARECLYRLDLDYFIIPFGTAWKAANGQAAAWWTPSWAKKLSIFQQLVMTPKGIKVIGLGRVFEGFSVLNKMEAARPSEPHWYLNNLAVDPELQGRRLGSALLVPVLWVADQDEHSCFLFIANPANEAYYARFGFAFLPEEEQPEFGEKVPFYKAMIRKPGSVPMTPEKVDALLHCNLQCLDYS
jgi:GNAT superfamily N-acetyltransferase